MTDPTGPVDAKARRILFETFWSSAGRKWAPSTSPDGLAYATRAGYMFPSETLSHDETVARVRSAVRAVRCGRSPMAFSRALRRGGWTCARP
jgi:hypothetical protein